MYNATFRVSHVRSNTAESSRAIRVGREKSASSPDREEPEHMRVETALLARSTPRITLRLIRAKVKISLPMRMTPKSCLNKKKDQTEKTHAQPNFVSELSLGVISSAQHPCFKLVKFAKLK